MKLKFGKLLLVPFHATLAVAFALTAGAAEPAGTTTVRDAAGLRRALADAKPGARILIEPGEYPGGLSFAGLRGEAGKPIVIAGSDPKNPPVFAGGGSGMHLSDPAHLELRDLAFRGASGNGLNVDDGGSYETPAHHLLLAGLTVTDVGARGNQDGIKLSGVDDFRIEGSRIERWGTGGGSAIDMVGCHRGVIEKNLLRHTDEEGSTGIQAKGGSSGIAIRGNRFESAGGRAVNAGGSTGLAFFRPPLAGGSGGERFEAKDILVEGNTFIGGGAAVAFVGADGAVARFNTIYRPRRWALRILQENREEGFVPCRRGEFTDNVIAFRSAEWRGAANVGPNTSAESFKFERNFWYSLDRPERSRPELPAAETGGSYGSDPLFADPEKGDLSLRTGSPAAKLGAAGRKN
jgi:hypothetical protein